MYLGTVEIQTNLYTNLPKPSTVCLVSISSQTSRPYTPQKFPRPTPNWLRKSLDVIFFHIFFQYIFGTFFRENAEQSASNNNFLCVRMFIYTLIGLDPSPPTPIIDAKAVFCSFSSPNRMNPYPLLNPALSKTTIWGR